MGEIELATKLLSSDEEDDEVTVWFLHLCVLYVHFCFSWALFGYPTSVYLYLVDCAIEIC